MKSGIYSITSPSGKRYIGSASNIPSRWGVHKCQLIKGKHHNSYLMHAFRKYGMDCLKFEILEICAVSELLTREQAHIDAADSGTLYNICKTAGSVAGRKHSDDTRAKMRTAMTPERRAQIADEKRGRTLSSATLERMTTVQRNRSETWRKNISAGQRGRVIPADVCERMSAARNTSGFKGVYFFKRTGRWMANLRVNGTSQHLGYFDTADMANAYRLYYAATLGVS